MPGFQVEVGSSTCDTLRSGKHNEINRCANEGMWFNCNNTCSLGWQTRMGCQSFNLSERNCSKGRQIPPQGTAQSHERIIFWNVLSLCCMLCIYNQFRFTSLNCPQTSGFGHFNRKQIQLWRGKDAMLITRVVKPESSTWVLGFGFSCLLSQLDLLWCLQPRMISSVSHWMLQLHERGSLRFFQFMAKKEP
jgi:hypothetical protein